jgi:hypothetical protein
MPSVAVGLSRKEVTSDTQISEAMVKTAFVATGHTIA